jgi:L-alanine-DL-glutamate epimerase-like enolase superfamily enzyme
MRRALPDADLLIDANSCYSVPRAIEVGRMLEANGFCHYEEPCPYWDLDATKAVTDALEIDVTGGEQDCQLSTWKRMIDMRAVDVVQPDIMYLGGLSRTLRLCRMAEAANLPVTPHCANLSMVTLFTLHLMRAIPNAGKYLEFAIEGPEYYPWQYDLFTASPYRIEDGHAILSDTPGWGVEINPAWLARAQAQSSTWPDDAASWPTE